MKYLKLLSVLFIGSLFFMTSCDPDNIDKEVEEIEVVTKPQNNLINAMVVTSGEGLDLGCFSVNYTFELATEGGNTVTIASIEDFEAAISDSTDWVVDFVYPLTITDNDDEESTIADIEELGEAFAECIPDEGWGGDDFPAFLVDDDCYTHVYPLDLEDVDGVVTTVNNQEEFIDALAGNYALFFVFPISFEDTDGVVVSVNSSEELFELLASCFDGEPTECDSISWGGEIACFDLVYPVSFETAEGEIVTANNVDELNEILFTEETVGFVYPITVEDEEGVQTVVNDEEELFELIFDCLVFVEGELLVILVGTADADCYEINYPVTGADFGGNVVEIANFEELETLMLEQGTIDSVSVTDSNGVTHEVTTAQELFVILSGC